MAVIRPFKAIRPRADLAERVAALPYDVMSSEEARQMVVSNPYSFLHIDKAEIDLSPEIDIYDEQVYKQARRNLDRMLAEGIFIQDAKPCFYIYRQTMDGHSQTGLVGCASIDDYLQGVIKKHEHTRADKEIDRIRHVDVCDANTGPIFLAYRAQADIDRLINTAMRQEPLYDFVSEDGIGHTVWIIDAPETINTINNLFAQVDNFYIADGHHRSASAVKVGQKRRALKVDYNGEEEFNYFLAVLFPHEQLNILDYNRVVKDLNGLSNQEFLDKVSINFTVEKCSGSQPYKPQKPHNFGMYLAGEWYSLTVREGTYNSADPVESLDVSILQNNLLAPWLGIGDPRTDKRIDFIGGIRGLQELEKRVDAGMQVAFALYPTSIEELLKIADAGQIMPPKSTWFEPKLRSGLFVHKLS